MCVHAPAHRLNMTQHGKQVVPSYSEGMKSLASPHTHVRNTKYVTKRLEFPCCAMVLFNMNADSFGRCTCMATLCVCKQDSPQMCRSRHWVVLHGQGEVVVNNVFQECHIHTEIHAYIINFMLKEMHWLLPIIATLITKIRFSYGGWGHKGAFAPPQIDLYNTVVHVYLPPVLIKSQSKTAPSPRVTDPENHNLHWAGTVPVYYINNIL